MKYKYDEKIENEVDFIDAPMYNNSMKTLLEEYPDGVPDTVMCKILHMTPEKLETIYKKAIKKLKIYMGE